jgi:hypothetical protein
MMEMWELELEKEGEGEDEKEGSQRLRRERVLRATLRARMRVDQRRRWDRTRNKRSFGGDGEGARGIKQLGTRLPIALMVIMSSVLPFFCVSPVEWPVVLITFFSLVLSFSGTKRPALVPVGAGAVTLCVAKFRVVQLEFTSSGVFLVVTQLC